MEFPARPAWSPMTRLIVVLILLTGLGFLLYRFRVAIAPLVLALILAFVLSPLVQSLEKRLKISRPLAILLTYLALFLAFAGLVVLVVPLVIREARQFGETLRLTLVQVRELLNQRFVLAGFEIDGAVLWARLNGELQGLLQPLFFTTLDVVVGLFESLIWIVFIVIVSIYLIKDSEAIIAWFERQVPAAYRADFVRLREELNTIWSAFFRGQLLLSLIVSFIITLEALLIGLPYALVMGIFAGLMEFMPSLGHGIWLAAAVLVAFFAGSTWLPIPNWAFVLVVLAFHILFTQFDLNYLIPRVIGRSVRLPPLVVILGIVGGAAVAGVLGVVLAAPTIASLRVFLRYIYAELLNEEPFTPDLTSPRLPPPDLRWWQRRSGRKKSGSRP